MTAPEGRLHTPSPGPQALPVPEGIATVYADEALLVLDKPAGLLCVPGRGPDKQDCLSQRAQAHYPDALVVHRLDMATSGLVLFARSAPVQRALSAAFAQRLVHKLYVADVAGLPDCGGETWKHIDLPIGLDWAQRPLRYIDPQHGQPSSTRMRVLEHHPHSNTSRVLLEPLTGRTHQLRLHMQAIGHPILGDAWYAPPHIAALSPRLMLHASVLELRHPLTGQPLRLQSPPPKMPG